MKSSQKEKKTYSIFIVAQMPESFSPRRKPIKADPNKCFGVCAVNSSGSARFLIPLVCMCMHALCIGTISNSEATNRITRRMKETKKKCIFSLASWCGSSSSVLHRMPCVALTVPLCVCVMCICFQILRIVRLE